MNNLMSFLLKLMGARDPYARGHSNHVTELSAGLARAIDLPAERIESLVFASQIHDLGKIAINEAIINKPGPFTEAEYVMVQHHSILGANLIAPLQLDASIQNAILHHHENYDGSGYPHKIAGESIPLESRILRIADTYDALIHDRVYRSAYSPQKARAIMREESHFFDPNLLEIFFNMDQP
ncbi:MAG: HD domain-containing protein [Anaerolineaceae bacterium]|nr:MAG: HD domain-containing protein [Anaerolineaceae bacterium]